MEQKNKQKREREKRIALCFTNDEKEKIIIYSKKERLQPGVLIRKMILDKIDETEVQT